MKTLFPLLHGQRLWTLTCLLLFARGATARTPDDQDAERLRRSAPAPVASKIAHRSAVFALIGLPQMVRKYNPPQIGPEKIPRKVLDHSIRVICGCINSDWLPPKKKMYKTVTGLPDFTIFVGRDRNGIVFSRAVLDILYWQYRIGNYRVFLTDTGIGTAILVKSPGIRPPNNPRAFLESWLARLVARKIVIPESGLQEEEETWYASVPAFVTAGGKKHRSAFQVCSGPGYFFIHLLYSLVDPDFPFDKHQPKPGYPSRF